MLETASKMIKHLKKEQAQQAEKGGEKGGNGNCPCAGTVVPSFSISSFDVLRWNFNNQYMCAFLNQSQQNLSKTSGNPRAQSSPTCT
eukprot:UN08766